MNLERVEGERERERERERGREGGRETERKKERWGKNPEGIGRKRESETERAVSIERAFTHNTLSWHGCHRNNNNEGLETQRSRIPVLVENRQFQLKN